MAETILEMNIAEASEEWVKICGSNRNIARNVINVSDGLKLVNRRILWYMDNLPAAYINDYIKVAKISGTVVADYHPHGNSSVYDAIVRMAQPWKNNCATLDKQGTFGNQRGDDAGQERYIHAALSNFAKKCFLEDIKYINLDLNKTYTDIDYEPAALPSKYPYMFLNGTSGVGEGIASNIPPYNFTEIIEATKILIENPKADIYLVPDAPTGAYVVDDGQFGEVCNNINIDQGISKYTQKARYEIDDINNVITITHIPFNTSTNTVTTILSMQRNSFPEIKDIQDKTGEFDVNLIISLKPDVNPEKFMEKLYKKTPLKKVYPINLIMIDEYEIKYFTIKTGLLRWIENRRDDVTNMFTNKLVEYMERAHILEVMMMMSDGKNSDKTIAITKKHTKKELKSLYMKEYGVSSLQAKKIAEMPLYSFTTDANAEYREKYTKVKNELDKIEKYLDNEKEIDKYIIAELNEGIKLFGRKRQSPIINETKKKSIPNKEVLLGISRDGFAKKIKAKELSIGKVGPNNLDYNALIINERDSLLIFDKLGKVSKVPVYSIPMVTKDDLGISLKRYFTVSDEIVCIMKDVSDIDIDNKAYVIFITEHGFSKKTDISEFTKIKDFKLGINLEEEDKVAAVLIINENDTDDIIVYTNSGKGMKLNHNDSIKEYSRNSKGLCLTKLDDEKFIGANIINSKDEYIVYITEAGCMKVTETKYLPIVERKADMLRLINLDNKDQLLGIISANKDSVITIYKKNGEPQDINVSDLEVTTRASKATKAIKLRYKDKVVAYRINK